MKANVYQKITDQIVQKLEQGVRPWHQPWKVEHGTGRISRPLRGNGIPYNGINILMLWSAAVANGYTAPIWMTYKQASTLDGKVRKGETGTLVVYADRIIRKETKSETGDEAGRAIPFMKGYTVFNVEQIGGLPSHYYGQLEQPTAPIQRTTHADAFFAATGANIVHGGSRACYVPSTDNIHMPCIDFFRDAISYYATLAHECTHWTGHESRLNRDFGRKRFGDEGYAVEELVAELGGAFLSADLGLTPEVREDHAAYIASWIKVLKNDKRAIFTASSHAQHAADYLHALQTENSAAA
ncbi:antirestriction protein ArdC [Bradyrhizobium sp. USDA 4509]